MPWDENLIDLDGPDQATIIGSVERNPAVSRYGNPSAVWRVRDAPARGVQAHREVLAGGRRFADSQCVVVASTRQYGPGWREGKSPNSSGMLALRPQCSARGDVPERDGAAAIARREMTTRSVKRHTQHGR